MEEKYCDCSPEMRDLEQIEGITYDANCGKQVTYEPEDDSADYGNYIYA